MTQTLRRERKQKFLKILELWYQDNPPTKEATDFNARVAELLADAAMSRSELDTEAAFGEQAVKPNIYKLYEENIAPLTPMVAERLNAIEADFPDGWFKDACVEAVKMNKRNLAYIEAILQNWKDKGRGDGRKEAAKEKEVVTHKIFDPSAEPKKNNIPAPENLRRRHAAE
jgi:DnaD/phage-associated family protein